MIGHDRFLYCRECNEIHKVTPFDDAPTYDLQGSQPHEIPTDDRRQFTARHDGHDLEVLSNVNTEWTDPRYAIDPMAESFVVAANDRNCIVLHRSRRKIAEPFVYRVIPRQLALWPAVFDREGLQLRLPKLRARWRSGNVRARRKLLSRQLNQLTLFSTFESAR